MEGEKERERNIRILILEFEARYLSSRNWQYNALKMMSHKVIATIFSTCTKYGMS